MTTTTADWYLGFAAREAAGHSPAYERLARAVVGASAGLCLYPDRSRYAYGDTVVGEAGPCSPARRRARSPRRPGCPR